ncbi:MAG: hypothetical protein HZB55_22250 [Deltaproteobacteria bacterium]|nr:hypothetical protein [Deltaproteobacteria bacterium]
MRLRSPALLVTVALLGLTVPGAAASFRAAVGEGAVYLYWGPVPRPAGQLVLYRGMAGGELRRLAEVGPVTDPERGSKILSEAPDSLSRGMKFKGGADAEKDVNPEIDRVFALSAVGYAQLRGYAYLDREVSRGERYRYRLVVVGAGGAESLVGEAEVDTGLPTRPESPALQEETGADRPTVSWPSQPLVRYHVERADQTAGPFLRLTSLPLVADAADTVLRFPDAAVLLDGLPHFYRVVPETPLGQVGAPSSALEVVTPDRTPPAPPSMEPVESQPAAVVLSWKRGKETDLVGYRVYRKEVSKPQPGEKELRLGPAERLTQTLLPPDVLRYEDRNAVPGRPYQYHLTASDRTGNESPPSAAQLARARDVEPPGQPQGLEAKLGEGGRVELRWKASPETDVYSYRLYRAADGGELRFARSVTARELGQGPLLGLEERLDPLSQAAYRYAVSAVDETENESSLSEAVSVRLPDIVPPGSPVVTALVAAEGMISLRWQPAPDRDVAEYRVYRESLDGKRSRLNVEPLGGGVRDYEDRTAQAGVVYRYTVSAVDASGNEGAPSEARSTSTFARPKPVVPTGLRLAEEKDGFRLVWDPSKGVTGYVVYVAAARDGPYQQFGALAGAPPVRVRPPSRGEDWYRVQAVYPGGHVSELSEPLSVGLPASPEKR